MDIAGIQLADAAIVGIRSHQIGSMGLVVGVLIARSMHGQRDDERHEGQHQGAKQVFHAYKLPSIAIFLSI